MDQTEDTRYAGYDAQSRAEVIALTSRQAKRIAELEAANGDADPILWTLDQLAAARADHAALEAVAAAAAEVDELLHSGEPIYQNAKAAERLAQALLDMREGRSPAPN